ncbi:MAG: phosphatase PAP2 family protein [Acetobacteraceae bacterium]|nr:phosphatase PAP2 family protein [Acetobacteraceae bacterium]
MSTAYQFWTDFADGAVMFPLGIALAIALAILGRYRAALTWATTIGCVWAVMLVLKFTGYTIDATFPDSPFNDIDLVTPSGHVASSAAIYGGLAALLLSRSGNRSRRAILVAIGVAASIGATRILLGDHSLSEVLVGAAVGIAGAARLASRAKPATEPRARLALAAAALTVVIVFHGDHLTVEDSIHHSALRASRALRMRH